MLARFFFSQWAQPSPGIHICGKVKDLSQEEVLCRCQAGHGIEALRSAFVAECSLYITLSSSVRF